MSLEARIESLEKTIVKLIGAIEGISLPAPPAAPSSKPAKAAKATQAAPAPSKKAQAEEAEAADTPDYETDVKPVILRLARERQKELIALLKEFGVQKGPELKPEQYTEFLERCAALEADDDGESLV